MLAVTSDIDKANVIVALNGPMAHVYVKSGDDWSQSNNDDIMLGKVAEVFKLVLMEKSTREANQIFNLSISKYERIRSSVRRLNYSIDNILIRIVDKYKIFKGLRIEQGSTITLNTPGELTELDIDTNYVNALERIELMNHLSRSGDLVLLMVFGSGGGGEEPPYNRYTTGVSCKSWHGSLNKSDSYVPFIMAYPGGNQYILQDLTNQTCTDGICKGNWQASDFVRQIIETKYSDQ